MIRFVVKFLVAILLINYLTPIFPIQKTQEQPSIPTSVVVGTSIAVAGASGLAYGLYRYFAYQDEIGDKLTQQAENAVLCHWREKSLLPWPLTHSWWSIADMAGDEDNVRHYLAKDLRAEKLKGPDGFTITSTKQLIQAIDQELLILQGIESASFFSHAYESFSSWFGIKGSTEPQAIDESLKRLTQRLSLIKKAAEHLSQSEPIII